MKKVFLCTFLLLGFLLIPKVTLFADSIVEDVYDEYYTDDSNMYFYNLPDIMSFYYPTDDITILYEFNKIYNTGNYDIDTSIDNGNYAPMIYSPCDISAGSYSEFSYSTFQNITTNIDLVWYDFYYTDELYLNTDIPLTIQSVTYSLSYYNELGRITTIESVVTDNSGPIVCFPRDLFDSAYKRNGVVKVSSYVISYSGGLPYFSTNKYVISNSRADLDLGSTYYRDVDNTPSNINVGAWLRRSLESFLQFELVPGFSLADIFALLVTIPLVIWILRMFMGG